MVALEESEFNAEVKDYHSELPYVLLVEDDDQEAQKFQRLFSSVALHWGQVRTKDGAAAVHHMVFKGFPDLLVARLTTPKLDAVDVAEWLGCIKCTKPVPMMVFDSIYDVGLAERLSQHGVRDYIDRDVPEEKLRKIFRQRVAQVESYFTPQAAPVIENFRKTGYVRRVSS